MKLIERFWKNVPHQPLNECWEWSGGKIGSYGQFSAGRRAGGSSRAHRWLYEYLYGPVESHLVIMHTCDNPSCVNPDHLQLGTTQDNVDDMYDKGRYKNGMLGNTSASKTPQTPKLHSTLPLPMIQRILETPSPIEFGIIEGIHLSTIRGILKSSRRDYWTRMVEMKNYKGPLDSGAKKFGVSKGYLSKVRNSR